MTGKQIAIIIFAAVVCSAVVVVVLSFWGLKSPVPIAGGVAGGVVGAVVATRLGKNQGN